METSHAIRCAALLCTCLLIGTAPARAQIFSDVVESLLEDHPRIQSAESVAEAGKSEVAAARAARQPQVALSADAGWEEGGTGGSSGTYILPEITASQLLFDGGRSAAEIRRSRLRAQALRVQEDRVADELVASLAQAWGEWSRQCDLIEISEAQVAALEQLHGLVSEIASFDRGRGSDVVLVGSRLEQARSALDARRIAREDARATVREIASAPVEPVGRLPSLASFLPETLSEATALVDATPVVQISELQIGESDAAVSGAKNWWQPQLNLEVARTSERTALGDTHLFNAFGVRLRAVSLPFGGGGRARLNAARATASAARFDAEQARQSLTDRIERLWMLGNQRRDRLPRLAQVVVEADEARDIVQEQFRIGRRSILDLLSYETERFNARSGLANEQHDLIALEYQLMGALGRIDFALASGATPMETLQ
ncbi:TolC family protein [Sphingopyxis flava]|uniref:Outer membrane protein TolC n=1 Tax=Sphingopyxis flava TaxID=1507287 RepID=A0A1T5A4X7_9SPHN|nr:TolC family protein [Sphingopyxis flava]SKB29889.1 Outer membrane protein TolC [Sphingopyxis flava]